MYPIWELPTIGAGLVIALIATFHILPSHLSVASMWFNVYVETKAYRQNRPELLEFNKKFTKFLLIFAYIFGSLTGVGIWFAITAVSPRGTSALIHNFVWGWATEWCFFLIEVSGIFIYYYTFDKVDKKTHLKIGWIFALASWITLLVITGILAFQLTPGKWTTSGRFLDGFFNPTYFAQVFTRTALLFVIGGAFVIAVASRLQNVEVKKLVNRTAALWGMLGLVLTWIFAWWWVQQWTPEATVNLAIVPKAMISALVVVFLLMLAYFAFIRFRPRGVGWFPALLMVLVLFIGIWSGERIREIVRKPHVIAGYMYSNQVIAADNTAKGVVSEVETINQQGMLQWSPFTPQDLRQIHEGNVLQAGKLLAQMQCSACHVLDPKGIRPLPIMMARLSLEDAETAAEFLTILGESYSFMPPFMGTEEEKAALAQYLITLNK